MFDTYDILTEQTISAYLATLPADKLPFPENDIKSIHKINRGGVNHVFRVESVSGQSFILKQSLPYLKCIGKDHPLDKKRIAFEMQYYLTIQSITATKTTPDIYLHDTDKMMVIIMEDLKEHESLRDTLIRGIDCQPAIEDIATFLANTLFFTSRFYLNLQEAETLAANFNGNMLREPSELFLFKAPFMAHDSNHLKTQTFSEKFILSMLELGQLFECKSQALVQGDLHTGAFMTTVEDTRLIDPEFGYIGPMAFDTGTFLGNLVMNWVSHSVRGNQEYADNLLKTMRRYWETFEATFLQLWQNNPQENREKLAGQYLGAYQKTFMTSLLKQTAGFAGVEICRRTIGVTGVEDIRDLPAAQQDKAETICATIGKKLVADYQDIADINTLITIIKQTLPEKNLQGNHGHTFKPETNLPTENSDKKPLARAKL